MLDVDSVYNMDNVIGLNNLDDESIDLTITSPPYDNLRKYRGYSFDFESVAEELYRVTKNGGVVVWVVGDETKDYCESMTSFKQAIYFNSIGFNLFDTMIYRKLSGTGACGSNFGYLQCFEYMFVFSKGKPKTTNLIYDRQNMCDVKFHKRTYNRNLGDDFSRNHKLNSEYCSKEYGRRYNVWEYNPTLYMDEFAKQHPATFPEQLVKDHMISWSNEGDVILDPFIGSGTTAKVAIQLNRHYIGFEISEDYFKLANDRINLYREQIMYKKNDLIGDLL